MASGVTLTGFGSGIDTDSIVSQLMAIERRPVNRLEDKNTERKKQLSIYSDIKSKLSSLRSAVDGINSIREFRQFTATSSDTDNEHFSVTLDSTAQATTHTIKVLSLAVAEKEISQGFASTSSDVGTGTFSITVGGEQTDITLDASNATLEGLRDAINSSGAAVTASIMNDGSGATPYRLVINSDESGTANAISIDTSGMSGGTPPIFTDGAGGTPGQQAVDASFVFNGVTITSSSNEIEDVVSGVNVNLKKIDTENDYSIVIESNIDGITEDINSFVDKYNDLISYLNAKASDTSVKRDYTFTQVKRAMQSIVYSSVDIGGEFTALSQIGISTDDSGKLVIDESELSDALEDNFDDVMKLMTAYGEADNSSIRFTSANENTENGTYAVEITGVGSSFGGTIGGYTAKTVGQNILVGAEGTPVEGLQLYFNGTSAGSYGNIKYTAGIMQQFYDAIDLYTDSTDGLFANREEAINRAINSTESLIEKKELALDKVEARLKAQFSNMELMLTKMQTQSSYLLSLGS